MERLAVNVVAALALCVLAVTLGLLVAPDLSWAAVLDSLTPGEQAPCPMVERFQ